MRDYITLGPTPAEEDCAQTGTEGYEERSREECKRFLALIREVCGVEPPGACLSIKSFSHDFGLYREVVCYYLDDDEAATNYAYHCEAHSPSQWDGSGGKPFQPAIPDRREAV